MRCLYVDLDGTLLGPGASLLTGAEGKFSLLGVRALEACARADVEVVIYSGRRHSSVSEASRLIGSRAFIFEIGCGLVLDGGLEWLTDGWEPSDELGSIYDQIGRDVGFTTETKDLTAVFAGVALLIALLAAAGALLWTQRLV